MESFVPKEDEIYFCDNGWYCPSWYYHFFPITRGIEGRSYLRIKYAREVDEVPGAVIFYVYKEVEPPSWYHKSIPVVWKSSYSWPPGGSPSYYQIVYFSCYIDFFDNDKRILDEIARLFLLFSYWTRTDAVRVFSSMNKYGFINWFSKGFEEEQSGRNTQSPLGEEVWNIDDWDKSPLLVLTDEGRYYIWSSFKHSDYFDHLVLWVHPQAGDVNIEIKEMEIVLHGKRILYYREHIPLYLNADSALDLSDFIWLCRLLYVINPAKYLAGCELPIFDALSPFPDLLEYASQDYGQSWDYKYGCHWCSDEHPKECEGNPTATWRPVPHRGWCGPYACYILSKHPVDGERCTSYINNPRDCNLTNYFTCLGNDYFIGPWNSEWDELTNLIKPGYFLRWEYSDEEGSRNHATFFIRWVKDHTPSDNPCCAAFYAIGGNQSRGTVSVNKYGAKNTWDYNCGIIDCKNFAEIPSPTFFWGDSGNFFGKTD